jgi:hypothetical protein
MGNGYEKIYSMCCRSRPNVTSHKTARLGATLYESRARISFLNRDYIITGEGVEPADGLPIDVNNRSVFIYYYEIVLGLVRSLSRLYRQHNISSPHIVAK